MTTPMHDLFDELATTVPASVAPPELAKRAYADGRRRRRARQFRAISVAAVVALIAGLVLPTTVTPELKALSGGSRSTGVHGYPRRIDHQWLVRDLPDRPGPIAALLEAVHHHTSWDEPNGWYAVSASGHRWRIPIGGLALDVTPTLSADGRWLGYMGAAGDSYVVHDLVTGRRVAYPQLGTNSRPGPVTPYDVQVQSPGFWSPDGRRLLLFGGAPSEPDGSGLVLEPESGALTAIGRPGVGLPAGWSSNDRIAWLVPQQTGDGEVVRHRLDLVETDLRGAQVRSLHLSVDPRIESVEWSGAISADGRQVAVVWGGPFDQEVHRFSLETGLEVQPVLTATGINEPCELAWAGSDVVVQNYLGHALLVQRLRTKGNETVPVTLSVVSPRVGGTCLMWAGDAIGGSARGGWPLGTRTAAWTWWWWRECVLGAVLAAGLVWLVFGVRRRLRRRAASHVLDAG